jgi:hypothetical protein
MSDPLPNFAPAVHLGAAPAAPHAPRLHRAGAEFSAWEHLIAPGVDWHAATTREYWSLNFERFRPGDTVVIHSFDHRIQYTMHILQINPAVDPVHFDAVFLPVYPPDLILPTLEPQRQPRYEVRQAAGTSTFDVIDRQSGERLNANSMHRAVALEQTASLERAALEVEAELARDQARANVEATAPLAAPAGSLRPAAAEGTYHLHDAGDGQFEVHGPGCAVVAAGFESREDAERVLAAFNPLPVAVADVVRVISVKEPRSKPRKARPRGRPRKPAPGRSPEAPPPPMAATAPMEG